MKGNAYLKCAQHDESPYAYAVYPALDPKSIFHHIFEKNSFWGYKFVGLEALVKQLAVNVYNMLYY
jgi:hypothetical protein